MPTHRYWGKVRKILEHDLMCASLKGRVRYFATRYRKAHDGYGRVCVLVDDKEIINMPFPIEDKVYEEVHNRKKRGSDKSYSELHKEVKKEHNDKGLYYPGDFGCALDEFLSNRIFESLESDDWLVRMLAIMDRRVGKRTLEKIKSSIVNLPEWLQYFYHLRFQSENIYKK